jgi:hypothetical protein
MKYGLLFLAAVNVFCQGNALPPDAEFDFDAGPKAHHSRGIVQSYFAATPGGLTFVSIGESFVSLQSADLNGRILSSTSDLVSVHASIYSALLRPDGRLWLVSSGPSNLFQAPASIGIGTAASNVSTAGYSTTGHPFGQTPPFNDLDLYSPDGKHLEHLRLLSPAGGTLVSPIAAGNDTLVLRDNIGLPGLGAPQSQLIEFGTVADGRFSQQASVRLKPPILRAIPIIASNGDLLLINKASGSMEVIDPNAKRGSVVRPASPHPVLAAAVEFNDLYLLSHDAVLKTDLAGRVLSTFQLQLRRGFEPAFLGVTGNALYLIDKSGHAERFKIQ